MVQHQIKEKKRITKDWSNSLTLGNRTIALALNIKSIAPKGYDWGTYKMINNLLGKNMSRISCIYGNKYLCTDRNSSWHEAWPEMIISSTRDPNICLNKSILIDERLPDDDIRANAKWNTLICIITDNIEYGSSSICQSIFRQRFFEVDLVKIYKARYLRNFQLSPQNVRTKNKA